MQAYTLRELIRQGTLRLKQAGGESTRQEVEWLLGQCVGLRPLELYLQEPEFSKETVEQFFSHIEARARGVPLQYLLGEVEFYGMLFSIAPGVFIPRPETEQVVDAALKAFQSSVPSRTRRISDLGFRSADDSVANRLLKNARDTQAAQKGARRKAPLDSAEEARTKGLRLLDLGTGSGCIALTLARFLPTCLVVGVEVSWLSLCVARLNAQRQGLTSQVHFVQGEWMDAIRGVFDGIIANPPYIPTSEVAGLPLEVRQEPAISLDGGEDGMQALEHIMEQAPRLLKPAGLLVLECGQMQVDLLMKKAQASFWVKSVRPIHDLAGYPRGLLIRSSQARFRA